MRAQCPLYLPLLLGTPWLGRACEHLAHRFVREVAAWPGVETELLDIRALVLPDVRSVEVRNPRLAQSLQRADGLILLVPEYGYGYPTRLRRALEVNLATRIPRAVGLCGLTAEAFTGAQLLPELLPTLRELMLIPISQDRHFDLLMTRYDRGEEEQAIFGMNNEETFRVELLWLATALRCGREAFTTATSFALQESDGYENHRRIEATRIARTQNALEALGAVSERARLGNCAGRL